MKKIAIFSDIHGNMQALKSILEDIKRDNFDDVICLGDIIGVGPNPKECLDIIRETGMKVVKGNHEIYQINDDLSNNHLTEGERNHRNWIKSLLSEEELNYFEKLPMYIELLIDGKLFTFSHFFLNESGNYYEGLPILGTEKQFEVINNIETDYMFVGHSHSPFQISNGSLFTCVGSSGCRKDNKTFYTILEIRSKNVKIYKKELEYNRSQFEKELKKKDYPDKELLQEKFFGIKQYNK